MKYICWAVIAGLCLLGFGCYQSQEIRKSQGLPEYVVRAKEIIRMDEGNIYITFINKDYESREALDQKRAKDRKIILDALKKADVTDQEIVSTELNFSQYIDKIEEENLPSKFLKQEGDISHKYEIIASLEGDIAYNNKAISVIENSQLPNKRQIIDTIMDRTIADKISFINAVKNSSSPKFSQGLSMNESGPMILHKLLKETALNDGSNDNDTLKSGSDPLFSCSVRLFKSKDTIIVKTKSIEQMKRAVQEINEANKKCGLIGGYSQNQNPVFSNFIEIKMEMVEDDVYRAWQKRHPKEIAFTFCKY